MKIKQFLSFIIILTSFSCSESNIDDQSADRRKEDKRKLVEKRNKSTRAAISSFSCTNDDLLGLWVDVDDENSGVKFTSDKVYHIYGTDVMDSLTYKLSDTYPNSIKSCYLLLKGIDDISDTYDYEIMGVSATNLTLMYLDRGNLIKYKKKN